MTAIVSPKPRPATRKDLRALIVPLTSSPTYRPVNRPHRVVASAQGSPMRLLSPIQLTEPSIHNPYLSRPSTPCSPIKRRKIHHNSNIRSSRRRHCPHPDCGFNYIGAFDQFPWTSHMESPPQHVNAWDIADLSLLPFDERPSTPTSNVGPIRRQKTALRSDPTSYSTRPISDESAIDSVGSRHPYPISFLPALDHMAINPRTPPPRETFNPFEVRFHDLMPVLHEDGDPPFSFEESP